MDRLIYELQTARRDAVRARFRYTQALEMPGSIHSDRVDGLMAKHFEAIGALNAIENRCRRAGIIPSKVA